jgi:signal peptidase
MGRLPGRRTVASALGLLVVLAMVAPFAVFAVPQLVGADQSYVVLSGSMEPYMAAGDAVVVAAVPARTLRAGDVITFQRGGDVPTTHRIVERTRDAEGLAFRTMGDANEDPDAGVVRPAQIIGEVRLVMPYVGYVVQFANTPAGMVTLVVLPIGLLVVSEAWRYLDARRRRRARAASLPIPAIRRVADATDETPVEPRRPAATPTDEAPGYGVKTLDLGLTFLVLVVLAGYSGWMLYNELRVESAMVLAGAVMAMLLVVATWVLAARGGGAAPEPPAPGPNSPTTDRPGGVTATPSRPGERGQETTDD